MGRTRSAKARAQEEYSAADKEVKRSVKKDKKNYVDSLAAQAEEAAGQGNLEDLYMITKKLANKFQQTEKNSERQEREPADHNRRAAHKMGRTLPRVAQPTGTRNTTRRTTRRGRPRHQLQQAFQVRDQEGHHV